MFHSSVCLGLAQLDNRQSRVNLVADLTVIISFDSAGFLVAGIEFDIASFVIRVMVSSLPAKFWRLIPEEM